MGEIFYNTVAALIKRLLLVIVWFLNIIRNHLKENIYSLHYRVTFSFKMSNMIGGIKNNINYIYNYLYKHKLYEHPNLIQYKQKLRKEEGKYNFIHSYRMKYLLPRSWYLFEWETAFTVILKHEPPYLCTSKCYSS